MKLEEVDFLLDQAFSQRTINVRESIRLAEEALLASKELSDEFYEAKARSRLGLLNMIIGQNAEAERQSALALDYFEENGHKNWAAESLYTIGSVQYKSSSYHQGLESLLKCLRYRKETRDLAGESKALKAIGYIYEVFKDTENAFSTYLKCREISRSIGDKAGESNACNPLSSIYLDKNDFVNALESINESIKLKSEIDDHRGLAFAYYGKAKIYLKSKEYTKAKDLLFKSLYIHQQVGENLGTAMCQLKLVKWALETENLDKAEVHVMAALEIAEGMNNSELVFKSYYYLHLIEQEKKNWETSLEYFKRYHEYKERVLNTDSIGKVKNMEVIMNTRTLEREAALQKEKSTLIERKNEELDTFVYRVSHDLKGPLSSLRGLRNVVLQDIEDKASLNYFNMYDQQVNRLNDMVMDLIDLTRMKDKELNLGHIDFDQMLNECISSFTYMPNFSKVNFNKNIQEGVEFYSDKSMICTITQNLIENAVKYAKPQECNEVDISIYTKSDTLTIKVADTGIGISDALQPKIFDMFFRANHSQSGTGLGLFILKKAVERLKGKIELDSMRGVGTTFTINLPLITE